jgi:adenylate cyclase
MPNEQKVFRKLSAIFSADVKGYSLLMSEDEALTIQTLKEYRNIMTANIGQNNGRVVDAPGDNILAEFSSAVDAVQCAVEIQKTLKEKNDTLADEKRLEFRIGVNIGDVVQDGDRIYGSGVNIAARIEVLADPGGICISRNAYDQIKDKLKLGYEYLGDHEVKNIEDPVRIYRVLIDPQDIGKFLSEEQHSVKKKWLRPVVIVAIIIVASIAWHYYQSIVTPEIEPASVEKMAYPLPDKVSIAVLPFVNMSDDPKQEYFSDGITESIIMALSKVHDMFVIARNSTFTYKGKSVKIQQVAEELGVRYVLDGSVQKTEGRVRIAAQLIDAISGKHMWTERYDRDLKNLFALQDELTMKIITALQVQLIEGDELTVGTDNLDAYLKYLQSAEQRRQWNKEGNNLSRKLAEEAIALDPKFAQAYLSLSAVHLMDIMYGDSESAEQSLRIAEDLVQKAIFLQGESAAARGFLGRIYLTKRQYDKAIAEGERAVALNPNSAFVNAALAFSLSYAGRPEEAIVLYKKAIRLSPVSDLWHMRGLGGCYGMTGHYEEAIFEYQKVIKRNPDDVFAHVGAAATYSKYGHKKEAQEEAAEVLRIDANFSLESFAKSQLYKNPKDLERLVNSLRKAGLPE